MASQTWVTVLNTDNSQASGAALNTSVALTDISPTPNLVLPANFLQKGSILRIKASGFFSTTGTPTLLLGAYLGGVAGVALGATGATVTASGAVTLPWDLEYEGIVRATGVSGSIMGNGIVHLGTSLAALSVIPIPATAIAAVTRDTTAVQAVTIGAQWGASAAANTITCTKFIVESKGI